MVFNGPDLPSTVARLQKLKEIRLLYCRSLPVELENLLVDLFREADTDGSGSLDLAEFEKLMATASLGLSSSEVKLLLSEADENADGCVSYQEFVPLAVEVVQTMRLKARYDEYEEEVSEEYRSAAMMIVGLSADEVATAVTLTVCGAVAREAAAAATVVVVA